MSAIRYSGWVVMLMVVAQSAAAAGPSTARQRLEQATAHWRDLDYDLVVTDADQVLASADASAVDRIEALRLKGSALVVLGRETEAVAAFEALFALAPDYELPDSTSPRILGVYRPAHAAWQVRQEQRLQMELGRSLAALKLGIEMPPAPRGGQPLAIQAQLEDPDRVVEEVVLFYRRAGTRGYSILSATRLSGRVALTIPAAFTESEQPYVLELHVSARHRSGITLRRQGDAEHPLTLRVEAGAVPRPPPITRRWWFWTGAAGLVAAAVAIPLLVNQARDVGPQTIIGRYQP